MSPWAQYILRATWDQKSPEDSISVSRKLRVPSSLYLSAAAWLQYFRNKSGLFEIRKESGRKKRGRKRDGRVIRMLIPTGESSAKKIRKLFLFLSERSFPKRIKGLAFIPQDFSLIINPFVPSFSSPGEARHLKGFLFHCYSHTWPTFYSKLRLINVMYCVLERLNFPSLVFTFCPWAEWQRSVAQGT